MSDVEEEAARFAALLSTWCDLQALVDDPATVPEYKRHLHRANQLARLYVPIGQRLSETPEGVRALEAMLANPNPLFRSVTAVYALKAGSDQARRTLEEIAKRPGLVGFGARNTLARAAARSEAKTPQDLRDS